MVRFRFVNFTSIKRQEIVGTVHFKFCKVEMAIISQRHRLTVWGRPGPGGARKNGHPRLPGPAADHSHTTLGTHQGACCEAGPCWLLCLPPKRLPSGSWLHYCCSGSWALLQALEQWRRLPSRSHSPCSLPTLEELIGAVDLVPTDFQTTEFCLHLPLLLSALDVL